jgi:hypothetical protein
MRPEAGESTMSNNKPDDATLLALKSWIYPALIVGVFTVGAFVLLDQIGLLPGSDTESDVKLLAGVLALIGTLVTAAVTFTGLLIKTSFDLRAHALAEDGERRNRVDTVIRAVGLLGANGQNATQHQISGAILALDSLGEYELAVALVGQLWPHDLVSRYAIGRVITKAFEKGSAHTQYLVAGMLAQNGSRIPGPNHGFMWPLPDMSWPGTSQKLCRIALVIAAQQAFIVELGKSPKQVPSSAAVLFGALKDSEPEVRNLAGAALRPFLNSMQDTDWVHTGTSKLTIQEIRAALTDEIGQPDSVLATGVAKEVTKLMAPDASVVEPTPSGPEPKL